MLGCVTAGVATGDGLWFQRRGFRMRVGVRALRRKIRLRDRFCSGGSMRAGEGAAGY